MPRSENYYDNVLEKAPSQIGGAVSDYPTYKAPGEITPAERQANKYQIEAGRSVLNRLPEEIKKNIGRTVRDYKTVFKGTAEAVGLELQERLVGAPKGATGFDYAKMGAEDSAKTAWHLIKAIPKEIAKAPFRMSHSFLEAENRFISKKLGVEPTIKTEYNLPVLGEVKSLGGSYDDDIKNGMSPATAGINTSLRVVGDVAVSFLGIDIGKALFRPKVKTVKVLGEERVGKPVFKELPPEQRLRATAEYRKIEEQFTKQKFTKQSGHDPTTGKLFVSKQNSNIAYKPLSNEAAAKFKGTSENVFWKKVKIGDDLVENSIIKIDKSLYDKTKGIFSKRFGKSRIVEGEFGPEIKIKSLTTRVGEKGILGEAPITKAPVAPAVAKAKPADIPGWEKMTDLQKAEAMGAEPVEVKRTVNIELIKPHPVEFQKAIADDAPSLTDKPIEVDSQWNILDGHHRLLEALERGDKTIEIIQVTDKTKPPSEKIISALGDAKRTDPACVKSCRETLEKYPDAIPERVIFSDTIENASKQYLSNIEKDVHKQLEGFTHIRVNVDGKVIESKADVKGAEPFTENQIKKFVSESSKDVAMAEKLGVAPEEVPSVMRRPIKGFENKIVTGKQTEQIQYLQESKNIDNESIQSISTLLNGKANINELTQSEAFAISETLRGIPAPGKDEVFDFNSNLNKSWTHQARRWMEAAERESKMAGKNYPVLSEVYVPMELGIRMRDGAFMRMQTRFREVFGKYSGDKYIEERRMIEEYRTGNTDIINKNKELSPEVQAELIEIAEWQRKWYNEAFKDANVGIKSERWFNYYGPQIKEAGGIKYMFKEGELPKELNTFFKFEREGMLSPYMDDSLALMEIYARAFAGQKFVKPAYDHAQKVIDKLPPNIKKATTDYTQEKMGYKEDLEKELIDFGKKLSAKSGGRIPENITRQTIDFGMTNSYAAALGIPRLMPIVRNTMQYPLMTMSDIGLKYGMYGWKKSFEKGEIEKIRRRGILVQSGVEYGGELAEATGKGLVGKAADKYKQLGQTLMKPYGGVDSVNRTATVIGVEKRFDDHWDLLSNGKISYEEFEKGIDMQGFSPTIQQMLRERFSKGDKKSIEEANDIMVLDIVDRTQFPYRRGTQTRMHYGLKGKAGLQFSQWIWEYAFTMKDWIARGQWDKVLRFLGTGTTIKRVAEEDFGIDVEKWVALGPFSGFPLGPIASMAISASDAVKNSLTGMDKEFNDNYQNIVGSLKLYGGPAFGVGKQRLGKFFESVQRHKSGIAPTPDPEKPFWLISSTGKAMMPVSFTDLLLDTFGFKVMEGSEQSDRINRIKRDEVQKGMKVDEAMRYLVNSGDWEGFNDLVVKNDIMISDIQTKLKSYNIPLDDRLYERLPIELKIKYLNLFYPSEE